MFEKEKKILFPVVARSRPALLVTSRNVRLATGEKGGPSSAKTIALVWVFENFLCFCSAKAVRRYSPAASCRRIVHPCVSAAACASTVAVHVGSDSSAAAASTPACSLGLMSRAKRTTVLRVFQREWLEERRAGDGALASRERAKINPSTVVPGQRTVHGCRTVGVRRSVDAHSSSVCFSFSACRVTHDIRSSCPTHTHTHTRHARARRLTHVDPRRTARRRAMTGRDNARVTYLIIERQSAGTRTDIGRRGIGRPSRRGKSKDFCE